MVPVATGFSVAKEFVQKKKKWITKKLEYFLKHKIIFVKGDSFGYSHNHDQALKIVRQKVSRYNTFYNFHLGKVVVRNQKSRWGSCSRQGNLSFSYKIKFLTEDLADYLVVHELCHLKEFNHSKNFWSLVSQTIPNWEVLRKEIKLISVSRSVD